MAMRLRRLVKPALLKEDNDWPNGDPTVPIVGDYTLIGLSKLRCGDSSLF